MTHVINLDGEHLTLEDVIDNLYKQAKQVRN